MDGWTWSEADERDVASLACRLLFPYDSYPPFQFGRLKQSSCSPSADICWHFLIIFVDDSSIRHGNGGTNFATWPLVALFQTNSMELFLGPLPIYFQPTPPTRDKNPRDWQWLTLRCTLSHSSIYNVSRLCQTNIFPHLISSYCNTHTDRDPL